MAKPPTIQQCQRLTHLVINHYLAACEVVAEMMRENKEGIPPEKAELVLALMGGKDALGQCLLLAGIITEAPSLVPDAADEVQ